MSFLASELENVKVKSVDIAEDTLIVTFSDGRTMTVPILWFPRLYHGSMEERANWRLIGVGEGIHWPDLDEDISVQNLLMGKHSQESQESLKRWLEGRKNNAG